MMYPSDELLEKIIKWKINDSSDCSKLLDYIYDFWEFNEWGWRNDNGIYYLSTGGWSGNEEIIYALKQNQMFWLFYWYQSKRGGHYIFCESGVAIE